VSRTPKERPSPASDVERVNVELRIYSGDIDPAEVTRRLDMPATLSVRRGESITNSLGRTRVHRLNGWFIESERAVASKRPEDHLDWLVGLLAPTAPALAALLACPGVSAMLVCTLWTSADRTSIPISSATLAALAALGVDLHVTFASYGEAESS
jgi:Domain of unknown function (DUF4279)